MENNTETLVKKRKWKNRLSIVVIVITLSIVSIASIGNYRNTRQTSSHDKADRPDFLSDFNGELNTVTASGTTSVGVKAVTFEIDFLEDTNLYVEEVYLSNGDDVQAGDKYIKFTEDSISSARSELESAALSADLSYRSGVISNGESKLQAKYTYDIAMLEAQFAQQIYDDTIAQLEADYTRSVIAYEDAQQAYNEYFDKVQNNTFYEEYNIANLKKSSEDAKELYEERKAYWEVTDEEMKSGSTEGMGIENIGTSGMRTLSGSVETDTDVDGSETVTEVGNSLETEKASETGKTPETEETLETEGKAHENSARPENFGDTGQREAKSAQDDRKWIVKTMNLLEQEAEEAEENYTNALKEYEDETASAELNLQKLFNQLETAREDYTDAEVSYQKQLLSARTDYETAVARGKTAQNDYDTQLTSLEDNLDRLRDARKEADNNLALFEELVGDGYLYIEESGTVLMLMAEEGKALAGGSMVFAYSNPEQLSVSVSVSQNDIAKLYVGEAATVMISNYGNYSGVIETINPVSVSNNRTSVSYTVTVNLQGDISGLGANLTASVIFGENALESISFGDDAEKSDRDIPEGTFGEKEEEYGRSRKTDKKAHDAGN